MPPHPIEVDLRVEPHHFREVVVGPTQAECFVVNINILRNKFTEDGATLSSSLLRVRILWLSVSLACLRDKSGRRLTRHLGYVLDQGMKLLWTVFAI